MRLFLLPISTRRALLYAQRLNPEASANASLLDRVTGKAATTWTSWERADAGWKKTVVGWGNAAFARIPYQEWGLKSVPRLRPRRDEHRSSAGKDIKVALAYPERLVEEPRVVEEVQKLGERGGYHRQWMGWSLVGIPFTAPVALVPIVPNLPFFYLAFRAWSHWKAILGSTHLNYLLEHELLAPRPSKTLQKIYGARALSKDRMQDLRGSIKAESGESEREALVLKAIAPWEEGPADPPDRSQKSEEMVATGQTGQLISLCYDLPQIEMELERALKQVRRLIDQEKEEREKDGALSSRESDGERRP